MNILQELKKHEEQSKELESQLMDPSVLSHPEKLRTINEAFADVREIVALGEDYQKKQIELEGAKQTLEETNDPEMIELAEQEIQTLEKEVSRLEEQVILLLVPPDPLDKKNTIVEIRAGAGGDESALFATELFRLYNRYAEQQGWKTKIISSSQNDLGGFKEMIFSIEGKNVFSKLKYESGVHRVQRVPETEKQGRVHTSTVTVAILPEAEEVDLKIDPKELKIEATTSTGAGGQSVNTTYSAVRIIHIPTGLIVYCQEERSQKQNKERAMSIMRARLFALEQERLHKERDEARRGQVGTGDRSEKIRTYNFPQDRITDHRINQNFHGIPQIMSGDLDPIITALKLAELEKNMSG
ncbi:MAG: Peptide chain release factor 1 [Candidatus Uhrbacteria bacterium GW2011_GWE2_40_58]|nr:MAG: Peptide chain release factor 1 [Candidatus Uhrbacteria bacterium GW2011_GWE2_40_58]OGL92945.1 MAG: peptide chain release factor 1 [Candidatus Uhrbacteria bacterium RIFOXYA2_FULL_40_9]OGL97083.1 MAG: peptide chain release factor 1 [Candidatus Uhrbacteria bacterium RIFOXYB2_FULL_41_18]HCB56231.1 peptide chain release factor 1 [Candidatus Uhrbacteria bacterium]